MVSLNQGKTIHRLSETYRSIEKFSHMIRENSNPGSLIEMDKIVKNLTDVIVNIMSVRYNGSIRVTLPLNRFSESSIDTISQKLDSVIHTELIKYMHVNGIDSVNVCETIILALDQNWYTMIQKKLIEFGRDVKCNKNCASNASANSMYKSM